MSGLKLNPAIAKETSNGQVQCLVCNTQVKPKVWLAHLNGRKHKECVENLKKSLNAPKRTGKRPEEEAPPSKRLREEEDFAAANSSSVIPSDFFDDERLNIQTPWQKAQQEERDVGKDLKGVIEGVPQGFFDDKRKDNMVRDTLEKNAQMDEEYDKLMREVNEQATEEEMKADEEEEREYIMRDIENMDQQMNELKRLNDMEIRKEEILKQRKEKKKRLEPDSDEDDIGDFDFDDWRAKKIL
ncbi:unnamed protein product [Auanema sp. JU1783]|nr:unnamed protein product [Auanema sp. JU1783]